MSETSVLTALQTGWLAVETFGLLRRYARHGKTPASGNIDVDRRFYFSERDPSLYTQLIVSLQELRTTSARLIPELPPPLPDDLPELLADAKTDLSPFWEGFDAWSSQVWHALQAQDPLAGQAFTCGGDLADTYWFAQGAGADKLAEMLRYFRLSYISERLEDLSSHLPEHTAQAIQHSLERWSIGAKVKGMDDGKQKRLLVRLESQLKVWRDLLFGLRQPGSYLTPPDQRRISTLSILATVGLVIVIGLGVWLAVLLLAGLGRSLMGSAMNLSLDTSKITGDVMTTLNDWQNWSSLMATLSSVVAVLTGVIKGFSGWLWTFHTKVLRLLTQRRIEQRTYRDYDLSQAEKSAGSESP
jgi:hypothetical protein